MILNESCYFSFCHTWEPMPRTARATCVVHGVEPTGIEVLLLFLRTCIYTTSQFRSVVYIMPIPCIYYALCCVLHLQYPCLQIVVAWMYTCLYTCPFSLPSKGTMVRVPSHSGKIRESGKITFDFSSQGIWEQMQTSGEIDKNCVEIRESDLLDCFTGCQGASEKSPQPHRLDSTDGCVCVCVCVCVIWVVNESEIPMSTFCGATHQLVPTHHLVFSDHLAPTFHLAPTHHLGSVASLPSSHYY